METAVQILKDKTAASSPLPIESARPRLPADLPGSLKFAVSAAILIVIAAINLACYYRSLSGYFLADDFGHVSYLANVFDGHAELLLQNFASNWMQTQGTQFYRPLISLTLALDYLVGGARANAFHISNLAYQIASSVFLFLFSRQLLKGFAWIQATAAAFAAALLFSLHPLHPEVVSWIIGRVDSLCTMFYLAAMWQFLCARHCEQASRSRLHTTLSMVCFIGALLSKEMAVTLPAVLAFLLYLQSDGGFRTRASSTLKATASLWIVLALYFGVRTAALGTIVGGYSGSIGEGFNSSLFKRLFQDGSAMRVLFPFNGEIFPPWDKARRALGLIYGLGAAFCMARLMAFGARHCLADSVNAVPTRAAIASKTLAQAGFRWPILFAAGWFVLAMLPAIQVWNLTDTLQCSRFTYLGTAPLCLLFAVLIVPLFNNFTENARWKRLSIIVGTVILGALLLCYGSITYKNNLAWVHASRQTKAFRDAIETELSRLPSDSRLAVLNVPQTWQGAHMIYNGAMLSVLLSKPLTDPPLIDRVISFEPPMFGDSDLISIERVRSLVNTDPNCHFYKWDAKENQLAPLNLKSNKGALEINLTGSVNAVPTLTQVVSRSNTTNKGAPLQLVSPEFFAPSTAVDFVVVSLKRIGSSQSDPTKDVIALSWRGTKQPFFAPGAQLALPVANSAEQSYLFPVSQHKRWLMAEDIVQLRIQLPAANDFELKSVKLFSGEHFLPRIAPGLNQGREGILHARKSDLKFAYDVSLVTGADHAAIEISRPDAWFEHYSGTLRDKSLSDHHLTVIELPELTGIATLDKKHFARAGYYQVRVAGLSKNGSVVGYVSDPINLQISP